MRNRNKFRAVMLDIVASIILVVGIIGVPATPEYVIILMCAFGFIVIGNGIFKIIDSFRQRAGPGRRIPIHQIVLHYHCDQCNEVGFQYLPSVTEIGTAICPECGDDMELDDNVEIL